MALMKAKGFLEKLDFSGEYQNCTPAMDGNEEQSQASGLIWVPAHR